MKRRWFLGLPALLAACSPAGMLNALTPEDGVTAEPDLAYGRHERQRLDIYRPMAAEAPAPVIVFLYGGAWRTGSRTMYRFLAAPLARRGHVVVVPDYRLYPEARFPDFLRDAAAATAWVRQRIDRFGGDPGRIILVGHSAGAHMALMLTLDPAWLGEVGMDPDRDMAGTVGLAGPYDFLPTADPQLRAVFPGPAAISQPIGFARAGAPPVLLLHGRDDRVVRAEQTLRMAAALRSAGGAVRDRVYDGVGHATLVGAVAGPLRWFAPVLEDIDGFARAPRSLAA